MGNRDSQSSRSTIHEQQSAGEAFDPIRTRLKETFYKVLNERVGEQPENGLTEQDFKTVVFPACGCYGGLLYRYICPAEGSTAPAGTERRELTDQMFVAAGLRFQQLTSTSQQLNTYFNVFSQGKETLSITSGRKMLEVCCQLAWQTTGFRAPPVQPDDPNMAAVLSMEGAAGDVYSSDFLRQVSDCKGSANQVALWLLASTLPASYFPSRGTDLGAGDTNLVAAVKPTGWTCLYDSNEHGLSVNRFLHSVLEYKGPTLSFITFQGHVYCIASDTEWRESRQRWGGADCRLVQLYPKYSVMQGGESMLYMNFADRTAPRGLEFGKDAQTTFLKVDQGLGSVSHYGLQADLHHIEVWGCAGVEVHEAQKQQKLWEQKQVQKGKDRKIKLDEWKDNPDRQLLEMGGVTTEHAKR